MRKKIMALATTLSVSLLISSISVVTAKEEGLLMRNGVQVTTSSSEMEAASANLATGGTGTARAWDAANNLTSITNANSSKNSIDLVSKTEQVATIEIDDDNTFQVFEGMGGSIDESTVYNLSKMSEDKQKEIIKLLIDPDEGLGYSMFRLTIGSSDFQNQDEEFYSYYDVKNKDTYMNKPDVIDWENGFSIDKDRELNIIKTLQLVLSIADELGIKEDIQFFGTPWTLPGWMKVPTTYNFMYSSLTNITAEQKATGCYGLVGGDFKYNIVNGVDYGTEYIDYAATYFVRYLEEYAKEGITVESISMGNETGNNAGWFVSNGISLEAQADLAKEIKLQIKDSTILSQAQKNISIWAIEWNVDSFSMDDVKAMYDSADGAIDGIALHDYNGQSTSALGNEFNALQEKLGEDATLAFTERSLWGTFGMNRIVTYLRSNCVNYNSWVTMLDSNGNSNQFEATMDLSMIGMGIQHLKADPTLLIQDANNTENYKVTPEAYMLGQFSKYIRPGFVRVDSTDTIGTDDFGISNVVFKNPETGEMVMVVVNNSDTDSTFTAACDDYQFTATVPATNVSTYTWNPNDIDTIVPVIEGQDATVEQGCSDKVVDILKLSISDNKDGAIDVSSKQVSIDERKYDPSVIGTYKIKVTVQDKAENETTKEFTIQVVKKTVTPIVPDNTNTKTNGVKTGDSTSLVMLSSLLVISLSGFVILRKKREN